jgi:hypothetical protein
MGVNDTKKPRRKRIGRLKTASDDEKYIARKIKQVERGEEDVNHAYKLVIMAFMHQKAVVNGSLEKRVAQLEEWRKQSGKP